MNNSGGFMRVIERYDIDGRFEETREGDFVWYADHIDRIAQLEADLAEALAPVSANEQSHSQQPTVTDEMIAAAEAVEDLYRRGTPETWNKVFLAMWREMPRVQSQAQQEPVSKWISVEERLPEIDTPVLAVVGKNIYALARVEYDEGWLWGIGCNDLSDARNYEADDDYQPTYWMPLAIPPAPEGDKP